MLQKRLDWTLWVSYCLVSWVNWVRSCGPLLVLHEVVQRSNLHNLVPLQIVTATWSRLALHLHLAYNCTVCRLNSLFLDSQPPGRLWCGHFSRFLKTNAVRKRSLKGISRHLWSKHLQLSFWLFVLKIQNYFLWCFLNINILSVFTFDQSDCSCWLLIIPWSCFILAFKLIDVLFFKVKCLN